MIKLSNGYKIPKLGLGTFLMTDENETKEVILNAIKVGYRHFDTAQMYNNEHVIGEALSSSNLKREEYYITTKLKYHHSKEKTRKLIDESFKKLKVDYIDMLLIHWPNHNNKINLNTWRVFEEYYEKGLIKAIGVSNFTRYQLDYLIKHAKIKPMVNQVEFHPALTQQPLKEYLDKHNINLMGYGPLMRGNMNEEPYKSKLDEISKKYNINRAELLIAWGLNKGAIMIPKTVTYERLISNFNTKDIKLKKADIKEIDKLNTGKRFYSDPANNSHGIFLED